MQPSRLRRFPSLAAAFCFSSATCPLLKIGDILKESRRFNEEDVVRYCEVSGDRNPIHLDPHFSRQIAGFERGSIVHGLLIASLFPSIIASNFPGAIYVSQTLQFKLPVYIEDEVVAEVQATNIRSVKKKYYVKWLTKCFTTNGCLVIDGEAATILPAITWNK